MPSLVEIGPVVPGRRLKCEKFTDGPTEERTDGRSTLADRRILLELSAHMS